jgi:hypothetical protein
MYAALSIQSINHGLVFYFENCFHQKNILAIEKIFCKFEADFKFLGSKEQFIRNRERSEQYLKQSTFLAY